MSGIAPVDRVGVVIPVPRDDPAHHPHGSADPDGHNRPGGHQPHGGKEDEPPGAGTPPASPHSPFGRIVNTFAMFPRSGYLHRQRRNDRLPFCSSHNIRLPRTCATGNPRAPRSREKTGYQNFCTQEIA